MSYGSQTFGSQTFGSGGVLSVSRVSPDHVSRDGGDRLTIHGSFSTNSVYSVEVDGIPAFSGRSGQGYAVTSEDGLTLAVSSPRFSSVGVVNVVVTDLGDQSTGSSSVAIVERSFHVKMFSVRNYFPSWTALGSRDVQEEAPE